MQVNLTSNEIPIPTLRIPHQTTGLTIASILALPEYGNARLVGGAGGLDRKVTAAIALEPPHATWLRGGELVLSAGSGMSKESWQPYLEKLATAGAAGLVVVLGPYCHDLPSEAAQICENIGFPLLILPFTGELTTPVQAVNLAVCLARTATLRKEVETERQLIQIALDGAGIEEII
ncbi:MAG TPA: PucR family transcriptional regulator ligand-binding domain-containing protein, partial [Chroococcales cyanobacterium]